MIPTYHEKLVVIFKNLLLGKNIPQDFWDTIDWYATWGKYISNFTGYMYALSRTFVMIIVFLVFILMEAPYAGRRVRLAFRGERGVKMAVIARIIVSDVSKYLRTLAVISAATGLCVWVALRAIGVDFAFTWGVLAFFLNFIPTIGSIVASFPPIIVALVQFYPDYYQCVAAGVSLLAIQFTIGNLLTPKIMGDALDLSPVVVLISLFFWGMIWGLAGALLSVPILAIIKIVCENVPRFNTIAFLIRSSKIRGRQKKPGKFNRGGPDDKRS
jgi:predicted PurR-regulated permease PerM